MSINALSREQVANQNNVSVGGHTFGSKHHSLGNEIQAPNEVK